MPYGKSDFTIFSFSKSLITIITYSIDQANKTELAYQVDNMQNIYRRASGTLIWLGPDECSLAKQTFAILEEYTKAILQELGMTKSEVCRSADLAGLAARYFHKCPTNLTWSVHQSKVMVIGKLYGLPWFKRLWVMQELSMSSKATSWWGSESEDSRWLAFVACCLINDLDAKTYMSFMTNAECAAAMVQPALGMQEVSVLDVMHSTSRFSATDPRDRIFALLGTEIFQMLPDRPKVDYNLTANELFRQ